MFDNSENQPTIHAKTIDISMTGVAMHLDYNLTTGKPVTLLLEPPAQTEGAKMKIIEIRARLVYCVHSSSELMFRVAMEFLGFKNDGEKLLKDRLNIQMPADFNKPVYTPKHKTTS